MRYYACKPKDQHSFKLLLFCEYWGHFHISEKLDVGVGGEYFPLFGVSG